MNKTDQNCLLFGYSMNERQSKVVFEKDPFPAVQTLKFGNSILQLLTRSFPTVKVASFCPIQDFPLAGKLLFGYNSFELMGAKVVTLPFINFLVLKHLTRFINLLVFVLVHLARYGRSTIIIHGLHSPYIIIGFLLKSVGCNVGVVITDESSLELDNDSGVRKFLKKMDSFFIKTLVSSFNFGIVLSDGLANKYLPNKPTMVIPGIVNNAFVNKYKNRGTPNIENDFFIITYCGSLNSDYGVDKLIDAVLLLESNVRLYCYGKGDQVNRLLLLQKTDVRFNYGGFLSEGELIDAMKESDLLVNVRPANTNVSKMSFPSKLLEYACTGKPILTTRLLSIPNRIKNYFYYIDGDSVESIAKSIIRIQGLTPKERELKGMALREKVLINYTDKGLLSSLNKILPQ
jgi:glycosyltransferase involved in cell wall biosynthesis